MAKKVNIKELSRRYTTAAFELAKSQNKLERVEKDLQNAAALLESEPALKRMLSVKILSAKDQSELVRELGKDYDPLTLNFLMIIARNNRLQFLAEIIAAFHEKIAEENGEMKAEITSARELDEKQLAAIAKDLSSKSGMKIIVEQNIKPEIIGGLIIKIGPKMFDYSIKSRLTRLKNKLKESA